MDLKKREKQWLLEEKYKGVETPEFLSDLEKLESGTPLAYLIGSVPFLGCSIDLSSKPLIPRPETEFWVDYVLKKYVPEHSPYRILDIFSGSGCIGIAILKNREKIFVDFAELKLTHCRQIEENLTANNIPKDQYNIFQSDIFSTLPQEKYDFIFANPPYISELRKDTVDSSVLEHEDPDALFAKDDGIFYIKELIKQIPKFLQENGYMFIEFDPWQKELLENYIQTKNLDYEFLLDQYEKTRVLIIQNKKLT